MAKQLLEGGMVGRLLKQGGQTDGSVADVVDVTSIGASFA
jgi:hypothetical protein